MTWITVLKRRNKNAKERTVCNQQGCNRKISPSADSKGVKICATCLRRSGKGRVQFRNNRGKQE